jgi:hypothetical protein
LVNALVPVDPHIHIDAQRRDSAQHSLALDYTVSAEVRWTPLLLLGMAIAGVLSAFVLPVPRKID